MVYGAARVCKGINLRGREAYAIVPNSLMHSSRHFVCHSNGRIFSRNLGNLG